MLAAGLDILLLRPQGDEWIRSIGFILLALTGFVGLFSLRRQAVSAISSLPKGLAFRGLLPFQEADRDRFYGRESETVALFDEIEHHELHFGVLYGDSGCGKTSLLRAWLLPKLWQNGFVPIQPLVQRPARSQIETRDGESPIDFLSRATEEINAAFVVVCNQKEAAHLLLRRLIPEENMRLTLPLVEITRRTQCSRETVGRILNLFVRQSVESSPQASHCPDRLTRRSGGGRCLLADRLGRRRPTGFQCDFERQCAIAN